MHQLHPDRMAAKLVFHTGSKAGSSITLEAGEHTIGRAPDNSIRFDPGEIVVSANHASITREEDRWILRDRGSRNGTYVNEERVTEKVLEPGDRVEFGPGGPSAEFFSGPGEAVAQTLDLSSTTAAGLFREARMRAQHGGEGGKQRRFSTTREFVALAYNRSSKRARVMVAGMATLMVVSIAGVVGWQQRNKQEFQSTLAEFAVLLDAERGSRSALEENLASIQFRYDSLLQEVEQSRDRLSRNTDFGTDVTRNFSQGVALIVYSYGFAEQGGTRLLRYQVDRRGKPLMRETAEGRVVPQIGFGGSGPPLSREGSATGFVVDSAGWIVTNRHVAEPWESDEGAGFLRSSGLDVEPRFIVLQAFFPPGEQTYPLVVHGTSKAADVAAMRTLNQKIDAPVLPMAPRDQRVSPGQQIVFIGYPTGVHNLLFRVSREERASILNTVGEAPVPLARELARRGLIQPLVINGTVSDTTSTEIIHTAGTTGGGSGGPLIDANQQVVGIHYAAVRSPIADDPFQTQRGVRVGFAWRVLPADVQARVSREP